MNTIILCEGFDDAYILGYYLHKTNGWVRVDSPNFPENYKFPKVNKRNQGIEYYEKGHNKLAIWSVGGNESYDKAFKFIARTNAEHPDIGISNLFVLSDRDDLSIEERLSNISTTLAKYEISISRLLNNEPTVYTYSIEDESYELNIIPIVIPFDDEGALETILMNAIKESTDEDGFIVNQAYRYVEDIKQNRIVTSYLQKSRLILKAKFSSVISITNPDRSTTTFNNLLMSHDWERSKSIKMHFSAIDKYL